MVPLGCQQSKKAATQVWECLGMVVVRDQEASTVLTYPVVTTHKMRVTFLFRNPDMYVQPREQTSPLDFKAMIFLFMDLLWSI